jgi:hypothetical protein
MNPKIPLDADEPITAQELYDFLQSFKPESFPFVEINGKHFPIKEMTDNNGNLTLSIDYNL